MALEVIVIGVDGSPSSISALDWAEELLGGEGELHAVHAVSPSLELAAAAVQADSREMVAHARDQLVHEWTSRVRARGRDIRYHVVEDQASSALRSVAAEVGAGMIAVGVHQQAAHVPRRIGRTVSDLVDSSDVPLAVIAEGSSASQSGTVVVAVGGGAEVRPALRWAVGYALEHDRSLSLVRAGGAPPVFSMDGILTRMARFIDPTVLESWAIEDLGELADEIQRSTDEELAISLSAAGRRAGPKLVEAGTDAALLVLESRPEGDAPVPAWVHHAIRHAPCPTVLFPPVVDEPAGGTGG